MMTRHPAARAQGLRRHILRSLAALGAGSLLLATGPASAQAPSDKPIRMIVGFAPGGAADVIARSIGLALGKELGQPVLIDNRPGADGIISAQAVRSAAPDGSTILLGTNTAMVSVPTLRPNPPYDPFKDFTPISTAGQFTMFLAVSPRLPVRDIREFLAYAKANEGKLTSASSNSASELAMLQLLAAGGARVPNARYKGDVPALVDVMSGEVQMIFTTGTSAPALAKEGKIRVLLTPQPQRSPLLPEVPTADEMDIKNLTILPWAGFFGPPGMPVEATRRISDALQKVLQQPELREQLVKQGFDGYGMAPDAFATFFRQRYDGWVETIRKYNVRFD